jgi:glycosyltransferase involved in cell wall biosynthesis
MNLLFLSYSRKNRNAGASRIYHMLDEGFRERGHSVVVRHFEDFRQLRPAGIQRLVDRLLLPDFIEWRSGRERPAEFDVVMSSSGLGCRLFSKLQLRSNRPLLVSHIFGLAIYDHLARIDEELLGRLRLSKGYKWLSAPAAIGWEKKAARCADLSIVLNDRDMDFLRRSGGVPGEIKKIPAGLLDEFLGAGGPPSAGEPFSILWFGSWTERKGAASMPAAFDLILDEFPDARLTMGGVHGADAMIRAEFSARANRSLTVLPEISIEAQIDILRRHSVFVFPSLSEGFGLALLEAMALGVAAVTTDTGFAGDYVEHGRHALVVPKGSAIHLAAGVITLFKDDRLRGQLALAGQALAQSFTMARMIDGYEAAFMSGRERLRAGMPGAAR